MAVAALGRLVGRVADTVLVAQVLFDAGKHFVDGHVTADFEETAAGLARDLLHDFLAVGAIHVWAAHSAAATPHARSAEAAEIGQAGVGVGEKDRVDQCVRALRRFDRSIERLAAAVVLAVAQQDEGLAAGLFPHDVVGPEEYRVIQRGASAAPALAAPGISTAGIPAARISASTAALPASRITAALALLTRLQLGQRFLEKVTGAGKVLQQLDLEIEVDHEGAVLIRPQHLAQKAFARVSLVGEYAPRAAAGIDQQSDGQRQVALLREVLDGLRAALLIEQEVVASQILDDLVLLVADGGEQVDHLHVRRKARFLSVLPAQQTRCGKQGKGRQQAPTREFHGISHFVKNRCAASADGYVCLTLALWWATGADRARKILHGRRAWPRLRYVRPLLTLVWETSPPLVVASVLLRVVRALLPLAMLWVPKLIIDGVVAWVTHRGGSLTHIWKLVALEFGLAIFSDLLSRANSLCDSLLGDRFTNRVSVRLMQHATALDLATFEDPVFYDKLERARRQTTGRMGLMAGVLNVAQDTLSLISLSAGLIVFSPWLMVLLVAAVIPAFLGETHYSKLAYSVLFRRTPQRRELDYLRLLGASAQSAKEVKIFGLGEYLSDRYRDVAQSIETENRSLAIRRAISGSALNLVSTGGYYGAYAVVLMRTLGGAITLGMFTFLTGAFSRSRSYIEKILSSFNDISEEAMYLKDLFDFFEIQADDSLASRGRSPRRARSAMASNSRT